MPRFTSVDETASQKIARLRSEPEAAYSLSSSSSHTNSPMIAVHPTSTSSTPSVAQKPGTGNSPEHGKKPHHHHHHHHHRGHKQPPKAIDLRLVSKEVRSLHLLYSCSHSETHTLP